MSRVAARARVAPASRARAETTTTRAIERTRRECAIGVATALASTVDASRARGTQSTSSSTTTPRVTRVVATCAPGIAPASAVKSLEPLGFVAVEDASGATSAVARDASGKFSVEFQASDSKTPSACTARFAGVVLGSGNPAKARNDAIRRGATSDSNGESCRGDAYRGCVVRAPGGEGLGARFVKASAPTWDDLSVVRVVIAANDVEDVAGRVLKGFGPEARRSVGEFKAPGITEFAAEDARTKSASTFVAYPLTSSSAIEIEPALQSASTFAVKALHLELMEGCGVVYL